LLFYCISKTGSFLIEDLYAVDLTGTVLDFLGFLRYAIKIPLIPFHTWQAKVYQSACCWNDAFVRDYVKMGLCDSLAVATSSLAAKTYLPILLGWYCWSDLRFDSSFKTKGFKNY
jgi:NADH-quinone oxidoreductase subunit M